VGPANLPCGPHQGWAAPTHGPTMQNLWAVPACGTRKPTTWPSPRVGPTNAWSPYAEPVGRSSWPNACEQVLRWALAHNRAEAHDCGSHVRVGSGPSPCGGPRRRPAQLALACTTFIGCKKWSPEDLNRRPLEITSEDLPLRYRRICVRRVLYILFVNKISLLQVY
jgi:hypothetical protein